MPPLLSLFVEIDHLSPNLQEYDTQGLLSLSAEVLVAMILRQRLVLEHHLQEFEQAAEIQRSLLPESLPEIPGWQFGVLYRPNGEMSGDAYDIFAAKSPEAFNRLGFVMLDAAGKGLGPSVVAMLAAALTQTFSNHAPAENPEAVLKAVHMALIDKFKDKLPFVTALYGLLEFDQKNGVARLTYGRSGETVPLVWDKSGRFIKLDQKPGMPLGNDWHMDLPVDVNEIEVDDLVIFTTDGVMDALGFEAIDRLVNENWGLPPDTLVEKFKTALSQIKQQDDYTMVIIKRAKK
jgi:phosphoserine phosphatase RsbU/P